MPVRLRARTFRFPASYRLFGMTYAEKIMKFAI